MEISFWKHHPQLDQRGDSLGKVTIEYQRRFAFSFVKLTPAGTWLAVCYGVADACRNDHLGRRGILKPRITHRADWQRLPLFDQSAQPAMLSQQLIASRMVCRAIRDVDVCATVFSPLSQAIQLAGLDTFLQHCQLYPDEVEDGLQRITRNTTYVLGEFADTGVNRLFYVMQHTQQGVLPSDVYSRMAAHHDTACLQCASALFNDTLVHLHGEQVYWGLSSPVPRVRVHYGANSTNPTPTQLSYQAQLPVVAGIPVDVLRAAKSADDARQLLTSRFSAGQNEAPLLTADCVLPLDFSDAQTDLWIRAFA